MINYIIIFLFLLSGVCYADDLGLINFIDLALENSPLIKKSGIEAEIASLEIDSAKHSHRYDFLLEMQTLTGFTFGRERVIIGGVTVSEDVEDDNDFVEPFLTIQFKYPIYKDGRFIFQKSIQEEIAYLKQKNILNELILSKEELVFTVADLYLDLVKHNSELSYHSDSLERLASIVKEYEARYINKIITKAEFAEVKYRQKAAQFKLENAKIDFSVYEKQYHNLLGITYGGKNIDYSLKIFDEISKNILNYEELKSNTLKITPQILSAERNIEVAELNYKLAKSKLLPNIFLRETSVFTSDESGHFAAIGLSFPFHNVFKTFIGDPEVRRLELEINKSKIELLEEKKSAELHLLQSYSSWIKERNNANSLIGKLELEKIRLNASKEKLDNKIITTANYLDQLDNFEKVYFEYNDQKKKEFSTLLKLLKNAGLIEKYFLNSSN